MENFAHDARISVAPFAGAWIEILTSFPRCLLVVVAPFAGAWIEIQHFLKFAWYTKSLPSRERGLKYCNSGGVKSLSESLPSRERGLKFLRTMLEILTNWSLPSRERGLKCVNFCRNLRVYGRSLRGSVD